MSFGQCPECPMTPNQVQKYLLAELWVIFQCPHREQTTVSTDWRLKWSLNRLFDRWKTGHSVFIVMRGGENILWRISKYCLISGIWSTSTGSLKKKMAVKSSAGEDRDTWEIQEDASTLLSYWAVCLFNAAAQILVSTRTACENKHFVQHKFLYFACFS